MSLLLPRAAAAQGEGEIEAARTCGDGLAEAAEHYRLGRFAEIEETLLQSCLARASRKDPRPKREEKVKALRWLALGAIARDEYQDARKHVRRLLQVKTEFEPESGDPPAFARLVGEAARDQGEVGSVSKTPESLRETPAAVVVVTAEQIRRRGYLDLEQIFHDLPGFDISRGNGVVYSNLYQRGFRANASDRILFLVDGVPQNDLYSNSAYISRQYPLLNVDRVEIAYGPASTIYGSNAYTGVVNVITKPSAQIVPALDDQRGGTGQGERGTSGGEVQVTRGSFGTSLAEFAAAARHDEGRIRWSLTGRAFVSDEPDLSSRSDWDFSTRQFDDLDYVGLLTLRGPQLEGFDSGPCEAQKLCTRVSADEVIPTPEGVLQARDLDLAAYANQSLNGSPIGFSDDTEDIFLSGKLEFSLHSVGFSLWRRDEGASPWYRDVSRAGQENGSVWIPNHLSIYGIYNRPMGSVLLTATAQFLKHELTRGTSIAAFHGYSSRILDLDDLARSERPRWVRQDLLQTSNQTRIEVRAVWSPSERFRVLTGSELRFSTIQGDLLRLDREIRTDPPMTLQTPTAEKEQFSYRDRGFFAQAEYRLPKLRLRLIAGGRWDNNQIFERIIVNQVAPEAGEAFEEAARSRGFGDVWTPRLALVWAPPERDYLHSFTLKAVYSEAFKDPSNFEKFSTEPERQIKNPDLDVEKVRNLELIAGWKSWTRRTAVDIAAYEANYSNVVVRAPETVTLDDGRSFRGNQFANLGRQRVRGVEVSASQRFGEFLVWGPIVELFGNYTYTDSQTGRGVRVGDIADDRFNLGVNTAWHNGLNVNLRVNYVGDKPTGLRTTVATNTLDKIDAYVVTNAALRYTWKMRRLKALPEASVEIIVNNLLDESYYHPGVQTAGVGFAERLPQPGRAVYLRLSAKFGGGGRETGPLAP